MLPSLTEFSPPETILPLPGTIPTEGASILRATLRLVTLATMIIRRRLVGTGTLVRLPRRRGTSETILPLLLSALLGTTMITGCGALRLRRLLAWTLVATILRVKLRLRLAILVATLLRLPETTMTATTEGRDLLPIGMVRTRLLRL